MTSSQDSPIKSSDKGNGIASVKVLVLAGGVGERLGHVCSSFGKPLIPVGNRPVVWYCLSLLQSYGFQDVSILCRCSITKEMEDRLRPSFPKTDRSFCVSIHGVVADTEEEMHGTAQVVMENRELWETAAHVLIVSCDLVGDVQFSDLLESHFKTGASCTTLLVESREQEVSAKPKGGKIHKPPTTIVGGETDSSSKNLCVALHCDSDRPKPASSVPSKEKSAAQTATKKEAETTDESIEKTHRIVTLQCESDETDKEKGILGKLNPLFLFRYPHLRFRRDLSDAFIYVFNTKTLLALADNATNTRDYENPHEDLESIQFDVVPNLVWESQRNDIKDVLEKSKDAMESEKLDELSEFHSSKEHGGDKESVISGVYCFIQRAPDAGLRVNSIGRYHHVNTKVFTCMRPSEFEKHLPSKFMTANNPAFKGNKQIKDSVIGENVVIKASAVVKKSVIGDNVTISEGCRITNSVLMANCFVAERCEISNSVVGTHVKVGTTSRVSGCDVRSGFSLPSDSSYDLEEIPSLMD